MPSDNEKEEKLLEALLEFSQKLSEERFVLGAGGNTSVKINDSVFIKPSGLSFSEMSTDDWVEVSFTTGMVLSPNGEQGTDKKKFHRPSSELQMHIDIYKNCPTVSCIFHAHPPHTIAVSAANISFKHMFPDSVTYLGEIIPIIEYCVPCGEELASLVKQNFSPPLDHYSLVMRNHGAITVGDSPKLAFLRMQVLEELAYMHWISQACVKSKEGYRTLSQDEVHRIQNLKKIKYRQSLMKKK